MSAALTLYAMAVDELPAYLDSLDMTAPETPERRECEAAIALYMEQLPAKVDRVAAVYAQLDSQIELAAAEIKRLQTRKKSLERNVDALDNYVVRVLSNLPRPKKGQPKLVGNTSTLALAGSECVKVTDESLIPARFKYAAVRMPAEVWEQAVAACPEVLDHLVNQDLDLRKDEIKKALKSGEEVAGADLEWREGVRR